MALKSEPRRREEFLCHRDLTQRLRRSLYFGGKDVEDCGSLPLMNAASQVFSGRPSRLRVLDVRAITWITHHACISPTALVMAMVYLERLAHLRSDYLQRTQPKQLFVASTLAASKLLYDDGEQEQVFNDEWAASAGMTVGQLNAAEVDFLSAMNWELFVSPESFADMLARAEAAAALAESSRRGWLTYSDLIAIGRTSDVGCLLALLGDALLKVVAVCSVAYLASVITLMSSVLLVFHPPPPPAAPPPAVFVARPPAETPVQPSAVLDQLRAAAASSGLLLLAVLTPLSAPSSGDDRTDRPDDRQPTDPDRGDAERLDPEMEVPAAADRWRPDGGEARQGLRNPPPDRMPWRPNATDVAGLLLDYGGEPTHVTCGRPAIWQAAILEAENDTESGGAWWSRAAAARPAAAVLAVCS